MRAARAAYCNYPFEVCTAYPWPRAPFAHAPGLDCSCSHGTVRHVYEIKRYHPSCRKRARSVKISPLPSVFHPPSYPAGVSRALNFSKIIAASSPLNRRDNRGVALRCAAPRRLMTSLACETQNEITFFRKSCLILGNYRAGANLLPLLSFLAPLPRESSQPRYSIRNLLLI